MGAGSVFSVPVGALRSQLFFQSGQQSFFKVVAPSAMSFGLTLNFSEDRFGNYFGFLTGGTTQSALPLSYFMRFHGGRRCRPEK